MDFVQTCGRNCKEHAERMSHEETPPPSPKESRPEKGWEIFCFVIPVKPVRHSTGNNDEDYACLLEIV
jgi:hypothetical protein